MVRRALAGGISFLLMVGWAFGGTPFGGDDGGFIPPNAPTKRCEEGFLGAAKFTARCVMKCHTKAATFALRARPFDEETCEQTCLIKFMARANRLVTEGGCPPCLDTTGQVAIGNAIEDFVDDLSGDVYCAPGTPFGGDDPGNVPADKDMARCQSRVHSNLGHLVTCLRLAHLKAARQAFRGDAFDDESLEQDCRAKYDDGTLTILAHAGCPPCLDAAAQGDLATGTEQFADESLASIYCASPSGAFLADGV